jgi:hypothetical protein
MKLKGSSLRLAVHFDVVWKDIGPEGFWVGRIPG